MVRRNRGRGSMSAAERRVRALAPSATTLREAVISVVGGLLDGVECPPTDLVEVGLKIGVKEIAYEKLAGSGELHKVSGGYRIVCSVDQSPPRRRFTVAHELAHVVLERTGRNAPRSGSSVERICDMLAAECLMPTAAFESRLPAKLGSGDVVSLARMFGASIRATAIRCAELRSICIFEFSGDRVMWGYGGVRRGAVAHLLDQVRDGVNAVMGGEKPTEPVYFYGAGLRDGYRRLDWIHLGKQKAMFMLIDDVVRRERVARRSI